MRVGGITGSMSSSNDTRRAHVCNCVGCCLKCGMCKTHPLHTAKVCTELQALNEKRADIFERAAAAVTYAEYVGNPNEHE